MVPEVLSDSIKDDDLEEIRTSLRWLKKARQVSCLCW